MDRLKALIGFWIFILFAGGQVFGDPEADETRVELGIAKMRSYICRNEARVWTTGDLVLFSEEDGAGWTNFLEECVDDVKGIRIVQCDQNTIPHPASATHLRYYYYNQPFSYPKYARYFTCPYPNAWLSEETLRITQCINGEWTPILDRCESEPPAVRAHCSDDAPAPQHSMVVQEYANRGDQYVFLKYLNCSAGWTWLTGAKYVEVECLNGVWTEVFDVCIEDCFKPRHCSQLEELGITTTGTYDLFYGSQTVSVRCEFSSNKADSGWSYILENSKERLYGSYDDYINGVSRGGDVYFKGFLKLLWMNRGENGIEPLVFQIKLWKNVTLYHATYDNVIIGDKASSFELRQIGNYHGTAGDALSPHLGKGIIQYPWVTFPASYWWDGFVLHSTGSYLSGKRILWYTCPGCGGFDHVSLSVRPKSYDDKYACPVSNLTDPSWPDTIVNVPLSRAPNAVISFACTGGMRMEGSEGGIRRYSGTIQCITGPEGNLMWNDTVVLPCTMWCPDYFTAPKDRVCIHFSEQEAEFGLVSATLECARKFEASLATFEHLNDLGSAEMDVFYYTRYTITHGQQMIPEPLSTEFDCDNSFETCKRESKVTDCVFVSNSTNTSSYHVRDCYEFAPYACMLKAVCPPGYTEYRGLCYKAIDLSGTIQNGLFKCNEEGSGLAYPENMDTLNKLIQLFGNGPPLVTGLHERHGNWTAGGIYSPDEAVIAFMNATAEDGQSWRKIQFVNGTSVRAISGTEGDSFRFICQYGGPIGCLKEAQPPAGNMTREWNLTDINDLMYYTCYLGYFVNGSVPETQQTKSCYGQIGGWLPDTELVDCYAKEVCFEYPIVPSPYMSNISEPSHHYINGSITYYCPETMTTPDLRKQQILNCSTNGSSFFYYPPILDCDVCEGEPLVINGTTDWSDQTNYTVGQTVLATCVEDHLASVYSDIQIINCTYAGWVNATPCYEACIVMPPEAGENMIRNNLTYNGIGAVLEYHCEEGYHIPPNESFPGVFDGTVAICEADHYWSTQLPLYCTVLCFDDPLPPPAYSNYTWDNFTRVSGTTVSYTCKEGLLFGNVEPVLEVTCQEENGMWSYDVTDDDFSCRVYVLVAPPDPPYGAIFLGPDPPHWVGSIVLYGCPEGQMSPLGETTYSVVALNESTWSEVDPEFGCFDACPDAPPRTPQYGTSNMTNIWLWGTMIQYDCPGGFIDGNFSYTSECVEGNWTMKELPYCRGL